jgi:hypothetical protein
MFLLLVGSVFSLFMVFFLADLNSGMKEPSEKEQRKKLVDEYPVSEGAVYSTHRAYTSGKFYGPVEYPDKLKNLSGHRLQTYVCSDNEYRFTYDVETKSLRLDPGEKWNSLIGKSIPIPLEERHLYHQAVLNYLLPKLALDTETEKVDLTMYSCVTETGLVFGNVNQNRFLLENKASSDELDTAHLSDFNFYYSIEESAAHVVKVVSAYGHELCYHEPSAFTNDGILYYVCAVGETTAQAIYEIDLFHENAESILHCWTEGLSNGRRGFPSRGNYYCDDGQIYLDYEGY